MYKVNNILYRLVCDQCAQCVFFIYSYTLHSFSHIMKTVCTVWINICTFLLSLSLFFFLTSTMNANEFCTLGLETFCVWASNASKCCCYLFPQRHQVEFSSSTFFFAMYKRCRTLHQWLQCLRTAVRGTCVRALSGPVHFCHPPVPRQFHSVQSRFSALVNWIGFLIV